MLKCDLTIIIPGIRPTSWLKMFNDIKKSVGTYTFELICIGPKFPTAGEFDDIKNFRFIRDFGTPSRCFQLAAQFALGKYICLLPDDGIIEPDGLKNCLDFMADKPSLDGMTLKYSEGVGYTGTQDKDDTYWIGRTHPDQHCAGVKAGWKIAPAFLYNRDTFLNLGGLDCRFEHINFNTHDLAYRIQSFGGKIHNSPGKVFSADHNPSGSEVAAAHWENDLPLFTRIYADADISGRIFIDYNNWTKADAYWKRKYKF